MRRRGLILLAAFLLALLALLPMRLLLDGLALDRAGLQVRAVRGSVWHARLIDARLAGVPLGDLDARLNALPLLLGRARLTLQRTEPGLAGALLVTRHGFGIEDMDAHLAAGQRFAPLPLTAIDLAGTSVRFAGGRCVAASGLVKASLAGDMAGIALPASLSGTARCEGPFLLLPLASQSGMERFALRLDAQGRWTGALSLRPGSGAPRESLLRAGFVAGPGGAYRLALEGGR